MNRALKQILFGGVLVLIIVGGVVWIYRDVIFTPASCFDQIQNQGEDGIDCGAVCGISCEQKYLKDLSYSELTVFRLGDLASVYFNLDNSNKNFGLKKFKYQIDFYGFADKLLGSVKGESFIYPDQNMSAAGGSKKIVEAGQKVLGEIKYAKVSFLDLDWRSASEFRSIKLENQNMRTYKEGDFYAVSGTIKNLYSFYIPQTEINAFLMDNSGNVIGISKTRIDNLGPFEEREYRVLIQLNKEFEPILDLTKTKTYIYPTY